MKKYRILLQKTIYKEIVVKAKNIGEVHKMIKTVEKPFNPDFEEEWHINHMMEMK